MASRTGFHVSGLNQVVRDLQAIGVEVEDLKDAFSEIAREGAQVVARHAPRLSGALAGDVRGNRAKSKAVVTAGRSSLPYAAPINYGWARHSIEPSGFMQKGDKEMQPYALRRLEADINEGIRRRGLS
jgi:hypothetical protein